jgi:hypothetical protein
MDDPVDVGMVYVSHKKQVGPQTTCLIYSTGNWRDEIRQVIPR